jgi:hypothetical protein
MEGGARKGRLKGGRESGGCPPAGDSAGEEQLVELVMVILKLEQFFQAIHAA